MRFQEIQPYGAVVQSNRGVRVRVCVRGDVVTDEMNTAGTKVAQLAFYCSGAQTESAIFIIG